MGLIDYISKRLELRKYCNLLRERGRYNGNEDCSKALNISMPVIIAENGLEEAIETAKFLERKSLHKSEMLSLFEKSTGKVRRCREVIEAYRAKESVIDAIEAMDRSLHYGKFDSICDLLEKYSERTHAAGFIKNAIIDEKINSVGPLMEAYDKVDRLSEVLGICRLSEETRFLFYYFTFELYIDYAKELVDAIVDKGSVSLDELFGLRDESTIEMVKKSDDPCRLIKAVLKGEYQFLDKLDIELEDKDKQLVLKTYDFIMDVHRRRRPKCKFEISKGFYDELKRAIDQGSNYKDKIENLREFCYDAKAQMRDNAEELMVVGNV